MRTLEGRHCRFIEKVPVTNDSIQAFSPEKAENVIRFHKTIPDYEETPLASLECTAKHYDLSAILVKDESTRFGLKAFKGLGGSYCMFRILCEMFSLDPMDTDYTTFLRDDIRERCRQIEFVTATDGNHGKGVSWAAKLFGCKARIFIPKGTVETRRKAIEAAGSGIAGITEWNYDETVRYAASFAQKNGAVLIQDTSWEGYEKYPQWIMEGYLTLAHETSAQMNGRAPTHIFLQAGVGSMAGAVEAYFLNRFSQTPPMVSIVEPEPAACIYQSALKNDGNPHSIEGNPVTIMAGLNCGTPCSSIWPILRDCSRVFCACEDSVTEKGMRAYARPLGTDPVIISGESGAVTYGLLLTILQDSALRKAFHIDRDSVILLINTEGDTDPDGYRRVVG